jgi:hypothetical protein
MAGLTGALVFAIYFTGSILTSALSAENGAIRERPTYTPNTEELRPDEMRVIALGTGLPTPIT